MSSGFASSTTRSLEGLTKEIEARLEKAKGFEPDSSNPTKMDIFTEDFNNGSTAEVVPGQDTSKRTEYQTAHDDYATESRYKTRSELEKGLAAAGNAEDQTEADNVDEMVQKFEARIKKPEDQFPGHVMERTLSRLAAGVDESKWQQAKDAAKHVKPDDKWAFVNWFYTEHGGK